MKGMIRHEDQAEADRKGPFPARILLSKADASTISIKVGTLPVDQEIPVHFHENNDQVEYYIEGKAVLYLEGMGEKEIGKGSFMYAPKGVKHGIKNVKEPLKIYAVFLPALF